MRIPLVEAMRLENSIQVHHNYCSPEEVSAISKIDASVLYYPPGRAALKKENEAELAMVECHLDPGEYFLLMIKYMGITE